MDRRFLEAVREVGVNADDATLERIVRKVAVPKPKETDCSTGEIFTTLKEAQIVIEAWRQHYNRVRPHSSLGCKPPAPKVVWPASPAVESARPAIALRPPLN